VPGETRILLLSSRDVPDAHVDEAAFDEPPSTRAGGGLGPRPFSHARVDGAEQVAGALLAELARIPFARVAQRQVLRPSEILAAIGEHRPDVVFNLCEGLGGDSRLEVIAAWTLERLGLSFTGSPCHALRHCLFKLEANQILARAGVPVPTTVRVDSPDQVPDLAFPAIVKPEREDGSVGIDHRSVVRTRAELREQVARVVRGCRQPAIVQRYVEGREIAVALLGWPVPRALPPGEIVFDALPPGHPRILTFASKWSPTSVAWSTITSRPAVLRPHELRRVVAVGRRAFEVLGLRDYGRVDVRLDARGAPFVIDVNPNCDLSEDGGFALACGRLDLDYARLVREIVRCALDRRAVGSIATRASGVAAIGLGSRGRLPPRPRVFAAAAQDRGEP
jgi:D-alanine-D-alanine ligase